MKKYLRNCILTVAALVLCLLLFPTSAQAVSVGDLELRLYNNNTCYYVYECSNTASGDLEIPATYQGKPVTNIGSMAFFGCSDLKSITIPEGVETIGDRAFYKCTSLQSVNIPNSVTKIGQEAFRECSSLQDVTIGNGITSIGYGMFYFCTGLQELTIPEGITSIGNVALYNCTSLSQLSVPNSLTAIGSSALSNCSNLSYNEFDNGKYLGNLQNPYVVLVACKDDSITACSIHESARFINQEAFKDCKSLTSVSIPDSVAVVGDSAFSGCSTLKNVTIGSGLFSIGNAAFSECTQLQHITLPNTLDSIGDSAFYNCKNLCQVVIPDSVTSIEGSAFYNCTGLTELTIGSGVESIGWSAFNNCSGLTSVTIPESVTDIGNASFYKCTGLKKLTIGSGVTTIGESTFSGCNALTSIVLPDSVSKIDYYAFSNCTKLKVIMLPVSVTEIDDGAFSGCSSLSTVFYFGTKEQSNGISISAGNTPLTDSKWHYNVTMTQEGDKQIYRCGDCDAVLEIYNFEIVPAPSPDVLFEDISSTSWQFSAAKYAVEKNLMAGKGTDADGRIKFDPNNFITREEFVQVLYNASGKPTVTIANKFPDVANNGWYKNAVLWTNENNIANGMGNGNFGIGKNITRQDLALMLYKYAALRGCSRDAAAGSIFQYADGNMVSGYAQTAMDWAVTNGILSGKGTAGEPIYTFRLDPAGTATRAECAAMLKNFMTVFCL